MNELNTFKDILLQPEIQKILIDATSIIILLTTVITTVINMKRMYKNEYGRKKVTPDTATTLSNDIVTFSPVRKAIVNRLNYKNNDYVKKDDVVMLLTDDDVFIEITSPADGIIHFGDIRVCDEIIKDDMLFAVTPDIKEPSAELVKLPPDAIDITYLMKK